MHYLYIIYSKEIDKYYVGETVDFETRLKQHNENSFQGAFTSRANDWEPKLIIEFSNISNARKAESFIKRMNSRKFIERLLIDHLWLKERFEK